jgi:hypothetical protein
MAYRVARLVGEDPAITEWLDAWQAAVKINTSWRSWMWHLTRMGTRHRQEVLKRLTRSELALAGHIEKLRSNKSV